jgi:spermidine synthase
VILLAAAGVLSMLAQVVVLRELVAALYGVELLYVLALGAWLVGTGLGAAAGRVLPATTLACPAGCIALGLLVPVELAVIRVAAPLAGAVTGAYLPFPAQLLWIAAATIPPAALCGWLFPALAGAAFARRSLSVGRSYAIESAGAAAGGAGLTAAIALGASTFQVAAVAPAIGAVAVLAARRGRPVPRRFWPSVSVLTVCGAVAVFGRPWDLSLLRRIYPSLVDAADTPYGRVILSGPASQVAVYENGALAFDTEGFTAEAFADLAGLQHARPARALVINGGSEGVPDALARHRIPEIHDVEVDRRAYEIVRTRTSGARTRVAAGSPVRVHFEEPRRFLERHESCYDLILVAAGEPVSGASSRFYTREFFASCARRLTRDGVLALRLAAAENVWPRPLVRRTASIVTAVREVFTTVEIVPGATLYVLASNGGPAATPAVLAARLQERGIQPRLITPPYLQYLYTNDRRRELEALLASAAGERPNTDSAPVCYRYAALLWLSSFYPSLAASSAPVATRLVWMWWGGAAALALAAAAWVRRGRNRRAAAGLFAAGVVGMVLETVLLLRFQIANGVVYQQVGWLLTCFMAGMAAGGWAGGGAPPRPRRRADLAIPAGLAGVSLLTLLAVAWMPSSAGLAGTSVLLAAAGAAVGIAFAAGAGLWRGDPGEAASALYAADVIGGAAGALAATVALVPVAGFAGAAAAALAAGTAMFAVTPRPGCGGR